MKTLITGTSTLYTSLDKLLEIDTCRIEDILEGRVDINDYSAFINYAHVGFKQVELLEYVFREWRFDPNKIIFNISSRASQPNISKGYMYAAQKAALNHYANNLHWNCTEKRCKITTMDLGAVALPGIASMRWTVVADTILSIMIQDLEIPQICMQVHENYLTVQAAKTLQRAIYP
jgi:NAD(P)-dependent dehydrogenase (short-subunit alcohol dehydrogenase family)